jgi:hypothetical protein
MYNIDLAKVRIWKRHEYLGSGGEEEEEKDKKKTTENILHRKMPILIVQVKIKRNMEILKDFLNSLKPETHLNNR